MSSPDEEYIPREPIDISLPVLQAMVAASFNQHAVYLSHSLKYTAKGSNVTTKVAKCTINYKLHELKKSASVYVKNWPGSKKTFFLNEMTRLKMEKEALFYEKVLPTINRELSRIGFQKINCAKFLYHHCFANDLSLFLEELEGFQALNRTSTLSVDHALVAIAELAKFHAASALMMRKYDDFAKHKAVTEIYSYYLNDKRSELFFDRLFGFYAKVARLRKREQISNFFDRFKSYGKKFFENLLKCDPPFQVLCHGGLWIKDILFSYDDKGQPNGCTFIDFQAIRIGSFGLDLACMMLLNMEREVRSTNMITFFQKYYETFSSVYEKDKIKMPFTWEEMVDECMKKLFFGFYMMTDFVRNSTCKTEECVTLDDYLLKSFYEIVEDRFQYILTNEKVAEMFETALLELDSIGVFDYPENGNFELVENPNSVFYINKKLDSNPMSM